MRTKFFLLGAISSTLLVVGLQSCMQRIYNQPISKSYVAHLITKELADILSTEYEQNNYALINSKRDKNLPDSKENSYDLEVLEGYIQYVKTEAAKKNIKNVSITIKYGQYPKNTVIDPRQNPAYKGYQTLFLSPIYKPSPKTAKGSATAIDEAEPQSIDGILGLDFGQISPPYSTTH